MIARTCTAAALCLLLTTVCNGALTVAQAKALADGVVTNVGPITLASLGSDLTGYKSTAQDGTGGMTLYGTSMRNIVATNGLVVGDSITLRGRNATFNGLYEMDNLVLLSYNGFVGPPAPIMITLADIQPGATNATAYQSMYVSITNVLFLAAGFTFQGNTTYTISNGLLQGVVFFDNYDVTYIGKQVPFGPCTIDATIGTYSGTPQLIPIKITPELPQKDPGVKVDESVNFGIIYSNVARESALAVGNTGFSNTLTVTGFTPVSGATDVFSVSGVTFPFDVLPGNDWNIFLAYNSAMPGAAHTATFALASNDPSNPVVNVEVIGQVASGPVAPVWINEMSYDDRFTDDQQEFIELCGPAGMNIAGWRIELWSGNAWLVTNYGSHTIGNFTFPDDGQGFGFYVMATSDSIIPADEVAEIDNIQNGPADAVRLVDTNNVTRHFWQYETDWVTNFPVGLPDDMTWQFQGNTNNTSLQLIGEGDARTAFEWDWTLFTPGAVNFGQVLVPEPAVLGVLLVACCLWRRRV